MTEDIIYPIEFASEEELKNSIDRILELAKSNPQSPERETFDFKRELELKDDKQKDEIRKDFSAFANTRGGWIIVGIAEKRDSKGRIVDFEIVGVQNPPKDEQIREILSASDYIRPPVDFQSRMITYRGKPILIYYIPEHPNLIEIRKIGSIRWTAYRRRGNKSDVMSEYEIIQKFYQGLIKLPSSLCVEPSQLRFYYCDIYDSGSCPYIRWAIENMGDIYRWIGIGFHPVIPVPMPVIPLDHYHRVYCASSRWYGEDYEKFLQILKDIENTLKNMYGINFEIWTIWAPIGVKRWTDDHRYFTGCNVQSLIDCIEKEELRNKLRVIKFAWVLQSSVTVIVIGKIHENRYDLEIESLFNFIPNQFPFIFIDETGRVKPLPLPAREINWWNKRWVKEWEMPIREELWREDVPDELLDPLPSAWIVGYLGDKPQPRSYEEPFRERKGLTLMNIREPNKLPDDTPPLITNGTNTFFALIRSAPRGLNDLGVIKLTGIYLKALSIPKTIIHDLILVLFSSECYVSQSKSYRLKR